MKLQTRTWALCALLCLPAWLGAGEFSPAVAQTVTAEHLVRMRDLDGLAVSPDGRWAAFQVRQADPDADRYDQTWHVVSTDGGAARRVADAGEPIQPAYMGRINGVIRAPTPVWSPDSRWIAFLRKDGGRIQIWRVSRDGWRARQLTHNEANVRALAYSTDGGRVLFETEPSAPQIAAALADEGREGFLYDTRFFPSYSPTPVLPSDAAFGGASGATSSQSQQSARRIWVYDLRRRSERPADAREQAEFQALTGASRIEGRESVRGDIAVSSSGAQAWTEARDPARQGGMAPLTIVVRLDGQSGPIACDAAECTGQRMIGLWWSTGGEVLFARGEGVRFSETALYAWRPGDSAPRLVLRTPGLFASPSEWDCASARGKLVCFYEQPNRPRTLAAVDLASREVATLYDPNPEFKHIALRATPQRLVFRSALAGENYGYLVLPPSARQGGRLPLVIVTYRCSGFLRGGIGDEYPVFPLAAEGFAVLCFNAPDTDYERVETMDWGAYQNWSRGPGDPEKRRVQEGLAAAIAQLDEMGVIDPGRVGVTGLSFGAETTSYALFNPPPIAAAIASGAGIEPSNTFLYGPAGGALLRAWGLGSPDSDRWDGLALSRNAHRVRAPLLLNVADHEMISALAPVAALEDAGRAVEMHVFPGEYHIKWRPAHRLSIYQRNIDWMNFWLRGVEDPNPAKARQYERWRGLRTMVEALDR